MAHAAMVQGGSYLAHKGTHPLPATSSMNMWGQPNMDANVPLDMLGMTEAELYGYLNDLLHEEALEAADESGKSVEEELDSAGFAAAGAASTYAIKLIMANNAYLTRQLLDLGVLEAADAG